MTHHVNSIWALTEARDMAASLIRSGITYPNVASRLSGAFGRPVTRNMIAGFADRYNVGLGRRPALPARVVYANHDYDSDADSLREPRGCRFITGHVGEEWRYCQADQKRGSSFCADHHALCHGKTPAAVPDCNKEGDRGDHI